MIIPFLRNIFTHPAQMHTTLPLQRQTHIVVEKSLHSSILTDLKTKLSQKTDDLIGGHDRQSTLGRLCLLLLAAYFFKNLFAYGQGYLMARVEQGLVMDFQNSLYGHFHNLPLSFFHKQKTGHLISRVTNDVRLLNEAVNAGLINLLRDPIMVFLYLGIMIILSWQLTLAVLLVLPIGGGIIGITGRKLRKYSTRSQERIANITSVLQETISGIRVVKAFAMEEFEIGKFRRETWSFFKMMMKMIRVRRLASPLTEFLGVVVGVLILWFGGREVLKGNGLTPEEFIAFLGTTFLLMQPIKSLGEVNSRIQSGLAAGERIFAILDTVPEIKESRTPCEITELKDSVRFVNVSASYDGGSPVLKGIDLEVKTGEIMALVGPSGAGKSTLVDLLPRFYDPIEGSVQIDGIDIRDIKLQSLRHLMGIVTQETILFNDTIWNNIAYGLRDIPEEKVIAAARTANADEFIRGLPEGYQTVIGDRGVKLSGGQRQRIVIARAILKDPPILIFDEATSALDSESEILVQEAIERLMKGRTVFVIAHRLSTIQNATRIVVLDRGQIIQQGTHKELMSQEGLYKKLYNMQFRN